MLVKKKVCILNLFTLHGSHESMAKFKCSKVDMPKLSTTTILTLHFEWYVVGNVSKNWHQKDMCQ